MKKTEVKKLIEDARQYSLELIGEVGDLKLGNDILGKVKQLKDWYETGMKGELSFDPNDLIEMISQANGDSDERGSADQDGSEDEEGAEELEPDEVEQESASKKPEEGEPGTLSLDADVRARLAAINQMAEREEFSDALIELKALQRESLLDDETKLVQTELRKVRRARNKLLDKKKKYAEELDEKEPGNHAARKKAWEVVEKIDPADSAAIEALASIQDEKRRPDIRKKLNSLKDPLITVSKNLKDVEDTLIEAEKLQTSDEIDDPELNKELADTLSALNDLRDEIIRASKGGASNERAVNFEEAIQVYNAALDNNMEVIQDDVSGEYINVVEALLRTREAYWQDLKDRASQRVEDAKKYFNTGYPELAVQKLEEADELVGKIHEGGEDIRKEVYGWLDKARDKRDAKFRAKALVNQSWDEPEPKKAHALLQEAKGEYPDYPDIDETIEEKEKLFLAKIIRDMKKDQSFAKSALSRAFFSRDRSEAGKGFEDARTFCQQALDRGANVLLTDKAREKEIKNVEKFLEEIARKEEEYYKLWDRLQSVDQAIDNKDIGLAERLLIDLDAENPNVILRNQNIQQLNFEKGVSEIQQAIKEKDVGLANQLVDAMTADDRQSGEVQSFLTQLGGLKDDREKYQDAERYLDEGNYQTVIQYCNELVKESDSFEKQAQALFRRAQVRVWMQEARSDLQAIPNAPASELNQRFKNIFSTYKKVENLKTRLPKEDLYLPNEAKAEREQSERDKRNFLELKEVQALRSKAKKLDDWKKWNENIGKLRSLENVSNENLSDWLVEAIEDEYQTGIQDWSDAVYQQACNHKNAGEISEAYNLLEPVSELGLLSNHDPNWGEIRFYYYSQSASGKIEGGHDQWAEAEKLALEARNAAPDSLLKDAQEFFRDIVRRAALKGSAQVAASSNPGPKGAIKLIEEKMDLYPVLKQDAAVRGRLIRYYMDISDYDSATDQAKALNFVTGEEKTVLLWEQLIEATSSFFRGEKGFAVNNYVDIHKRGLSSKEVNENLREIYDYQVGKFLADLRRDIGLSKPDLSNTELVERIQLLDLILQLEPEDGDAQKKLRVLADRLGNLLVPLRQDAQKIKLGDSILDSLNKGNKLEREIRAVIRAMHVTKGDQNTILALEKSLKQITEKTQKWHSALEKLYEIESEWGKSIGGTWDTQSLNEILDAALEICNIEDTDEFQYWEPRVKALKNGLDGVGDDSGLRGLIDSLHESWRSENFNDVIGILNLLEDAEKSLKSELEEAQFVIPKSIITLNDPYFDQTEVSNFQEIRDLVKQKSQNLASWNEWMDKLNQELEKIQEMETQVREWLNDEPPCLTTSLEYLNDCAGILENVPEIIETQPEKVYSSQAKQIANQADKDLVFDAADQKKDLISNQILDVHTKLEDTQTPVNLIDKFVKRKLKLSNARNLKTLRNLVKNLREIDRCHPDIKKYDDLINQFSRGKK